MKLRRWIFGLVVVSQVASSGCMLFHRHDRCCSGERHGLFGCLSKRRGESSGIIVGGGMDCAPGCTTCGGGELPMMTGPMLTGPGGPAPDERLGAPAANRAWDGSAGAPPAQLPKTNAPSR